MLNWASHQERCCTLGSPLSYWTIQWWVPTKAQLDCLCYGGVCTQLLLHDGHFDKTLLQHGSPVLWKEQLKTFIGWSVCLSKWGRLAGFYLGFIFWGGGGGKMNLGSAWKGCGHRPQCLGGSGGMPPRKIFKFEPSDWGILRKKMKS